MLEIKPRVERVTVFDRFRLRDAPSLEERATAGDAPLGSHAFSLTALPPTMRFSLRMDGAAAERMGLLVDFQIDTAINQAAISGARTSVRLGPDEWLLIGDDDAPSLLADKLEAQLGGVPHSLVDVSHRQIGFRLSGTRARDVLNTGCPLDLGAHVFGAGSATRTVFSKAQIVVWRLVEQDVNDVFRLECNRSFARYLYRHLSDSAVLIGVKN